MCFEDKLDPLAAAITLFMPVHDQASAKAMITDHTHLTGGRASQVTKLAEQLYSNRHRYGLEKELAAVVGTNNQKSALREAIMLNLRKQTGTLVRT